MMTMRKDILMENMGCVRHPDYKTEIAAIVKSNLTPKIMRDRILDYHENDIAAAMELLTKEERNKIYSLLDVETLANTLEYSGELNYYIEELGIRRRVEVLSQLESATASAYLNQVEKSERLMMIDLMDEDVKKDILLLSAYDEDEIGSKMTTNYVSVRAGVDVREAMRELIDQAAENDNISTLYVVDQDEILVGAIDLKDLIIARENTDLESITMTSYPYVYAGEMTEECIERIKEYSEDSIPVLDDKNRLCGVITAQEIACLVDDELGEDYAKLAGLSAEEDLNEPVRKSIGKRLPWLVALLGLGLVVSAVVGLFEEVMAGLTILVCFQSLILDMAGNVGTQSLAVTIRVLMDENLTGKQKLSLVLKEAQVGLFNGVILGVLSFACIGGYLVLMKGEAAMFGFAVSACIGIALLVSMLLSSVAGTAIPIFFKMLKIDPAVASGPLITTVNDLVAVVTYYGLAGLMLMRMV